jgi:hypothetical protein
VLNRAKPCLRAGSNRLQTPRHCAPAERDQLAAKTVPRKALGAIPASRSHMPGHVSMSPRPRVGYHYSMAFFTRPAAILDSKLYEYVRCTFSVYTLTAVVTTRVVRIAVTVTRSAWGPNRTFSERRGIGIASGRARRGTCKSTCEAAPIKPGQNPASSSVCHECCDAVSAHWASLPAQGPTEVRACERFATALSFRYTTVVARAHSGRLRRLQQARAGSRD